MKLTKHYFFVLTVFALVAGHSLAFADLTVGIHAGSLLTTSVPGQWRTKYLGGPHDASGQPNTSFDWASQRSYYADGTLDTSNAAGYGPAFKINANFPNQTQSWDRNSSVGLVDWISAMNQGIGPNGYYSFATTINDKLNQLGSNQTITLDHLKLTFASDENMRAIVINGVIYSVSEAQWPQSPDYTGWTAGNYTSLSLSGITNWNINGTNTIEFVVYNTGIQPDGTFTNNNNPIGLSANIQAFYIVSDNNNVIAHNPEPATLLLWTLGGMGLAGSSWVRKRRMK